VQQSLSGSLLRVMEVMEVMKVMDARTLRDD
jgi:hypothetical protein